MKKKIIILSLIAMTGLVGCSNNQNEEAQPQIGENTGQVRNAGNGFNTTNVGHESENPYSHNYNGDYTGAQQTSHEINIRSAQQVASRAQEAAKRISGVSRATSISQGMDIVVGIDADHTGDLKGLEDRVRQAIVRREQGYNVYVTADEEIHERIQRLFTNMNNVKTSNVTSGISEIIYQIGQKNAQR
jgi:hypothetical protein